MSAGEVLWLELGRGAYACDGVVPREKHAFDCFLCVAVESGHGVSSRGAPELWCAALVGSPRRPCRLKYNKKRKTIQKQSIDSRVLTVGMYGGKSSAFGETQGAKVNTLLLVKMLTALHVHHGESVLCRHECCVENAVYSCSTGGPYKRVRVDTTWKGMCHLIYVYDYYYYRY